VKNRCRKIAVNNLKQRGAVKAGQNGAGSVGGKRPGSGIINQHALRQTARKKNFQLGGRLFKPEIHKKGLSEKATLKGSRRIRRVTAGKIP